MNIFGFTSLDTALSMAGLNLCQLMTDFIFHQTQLGALIFAFGFCLAIGKVVQSGHYRDLMIFMAMVLGLIFIVLPHHEQSDFSSALEAYGHSQQKAKEIKAGLMASEQIPSILSFIVQTMDAVLIAGIHAIDAIMPSWAQYLNGPFALHQTALHIQELLLYEIHSRPFEVKLSAFLNGHYLPALSMVKHSGLSIDLDKLWPGHELILRHYSNDAKSQWENIRRDLVQFLNEDSSLALGDFKRSGFFNENQLANLDAALIKSYMEHRLNPAPDHRSSFSLNVFSRMIIACFSYFYGCANMILFVLFPFILIAMAFMRNLNILGHYFKSLIWVKSWMLCSAMSFYASLFIAKIQTQVSSDPAWFWQQPYFCTAAAMVLLFMPMASFLLIYKGGKLWGML